MNKRELATEVLAALLNVSLSKADDLAEKNHGVYKNLMTHKKPRLTELYEQATVVLKQRGVR